MGAVRALAVTAQRRNKKYNEKKNQLNEFTAHIEHIRYVVRYGISFGRVQSNDRIYTQLGWSELSLCMRTDGSGGREMMTCDVFT